MQRKEHKCDTETARFHTIFSWNKVDTTNDDHRAVNFSTSFKFHTKFNVKSKTSGLQKELTMLVLKGLFLFGFHSLRTKPLLRGNVIEIFNKNNEVSEEFSD